MRGLSHLMNLRLNSLQSDVGYIFPPPALSPLFARANQTWSVIIQNGQRGGGEQPEQRDAAMQEKPLLPETHVPR